MNTPRESVRRGVELPSDYVDIDGLCPDLQPSRLRERIGHRPNSETLQPPVIPMPTSIRSRSLRLTVVVCLLSGLLVGHVSVRYLFGTLFGFVKYRGLAPVAPWVVLLLYLLLLIGVAVRATIRRGIPGITLGLGLLLLAVEPLVSSFIWGDGCEAGSASQASLLPEISVSGARVTLFAWNGSCSVSVTPAIIGISILLLGSALWMGNLPETTHGRWTAFVDAYLPSQTSE